MSEKHGCLKAGLFGCLGVLGVLTLLAGGTALVAWNHAGKVRTREEVLTPGTAGAPSPVKGAKVTEVPPGTGRVVLDLSQGEFEIHPGKPGQGVRVEATYDGEVYLLEDYFESFPDSNWVYGVRSHRTISGLHAFFRQLINGGNSPRIEVYLPVDTPLELQIQVKEGGFEAELGGLWVTRADFRYQKGGVSLDFDEPLKEPMASLSIRGSMGGVEAAGLGNASPRALDVTCRMGGADLDLRGAWTRDADIRLKVVMGGISVTVPDDVRIQGLESFPTDRLAGDEEISLPLLRFSIIENMGEIEVSH